VGSENGRPATPYQLSQRADFVETLMGTQTTHSRPIVNSRDEALCGSRSYRVSGASDGPGLARLHCIFFDNTLCHVASLLKVGVTQIILAMIEAGVTELDLLLDDPVGAVVHWSHGADLGARSRLISGEEVTAVELQLRFLAQAKRFAQTGGLDTVPRAGEILDLWEDTLLKLRARDLASLTGRLDWVLKLHVIKHSLRQRSDLDWDSPELKHLDLLYGSLDPSEGLYWAYEDSGLVDRVVSEDEIQHFVHEPPEDTRAWTRAMLLRCLNPERVSRVDWDRVKIRLDPDRGFTEVAEVRLDDPLGFTRSETGALFGRARSLEEIARGLVGESGDPGEEAPAVVTVSRGWQYQH
jgi:proteasome accessory factor A